MAKILKRRGIISKQAAKVLAATDLAATRFQRRGREQE